MLGRIANLFKAFLNMIVVDQGVASINQLAGKVVAGSQFNESEFFLRYLAQEAGLQVKVLRDLDARPGPHEVGMVFYEDAFAACDAYAYELKGSQPRLSGCVGWSPKTDEVIAGSQGKAKMLVSNRNLLVIADILTVNKGFAQANPKMVAGIVHGGRGFVQSSTTHFRCRYPACGRSFSLLLVT